MAYQEYQKTVQVNNIDSEQTQRLAVGLEGFGDTVIQEGDYTSAMPTNSRRMSNNSETDNQQ